MEVNDSKSASPIKHIASGKRKKSIKSDSHSTSNVPGKDSMNCRICLKPGKIPIYDEQKIPAAIITFGKIEISIHDNFPKFLCFACYNLLHSAILFRKRAQETDKLLKNHQKPIDNAKSSVEPESTNSEVKDVASDDNINDEDSDERNTKEHHCDRCNIDLKDWQSYCDHIKSEEHKKCKVKCPICNRMYFPLYLKIHILRHRLDPGQAFVCDICGKSFVVRGAFNTHRATHTLELPFKCHLCPYRGRFNHTLKTHMRVHTGEKPFTCPHCASRFVDRSNFHKHVLRHNRFRDSKCNQCGRCFFTKKDLEGHIKVLHSGIKEHICDICGRPFGYRKQMLKHQLTIHKREKLIVSQPLHVQAQHLQSSEDQSNECT